MNLSPRQRDILDWLRDSHHLSTEQLAGRFGVSTQTIRRDIHNLSELGLTRRQHGGVSLPASQHNLSFSRRSDAQIERKRRIARAATTVVPPDATVFLGYGTTVAEFARALPGNRPLRAVTNNLDAALALADKPAVETWLACGRLRGADRDVMGSATLEYLRRFRVHLSILGVGGVADDGALCEFQPDEADLTRVLLAHSHANILLADSSKFLRVAPCHVAGLDTIDHWFTDDDASDAVQALCARAGVDLHRC